MYGIFYDLTDTINRLDFALDSYFMDIKLFNKLYLTGSVELACRHRINTTLEKGKKNGIE